MADGGEGLSFDSGSRLLGQVEMSSMRWPSGSFTTVRRPHSVSAAGVMIWPPWMTRAAAEIRHEFTIYETPEEIFPAKYANGGE
jgi:hypothetical protein